VKHRRGHNLHCIHVATSEQDVVIKWSIDKFIVSDESFSLKFNGDILEDSLGRGGSSVISLQSNGGWYDIRRANFMPGYFGHDACGCTFINNATMNCDVPDFNSYLERDQSQEKRFPAIEIKGDESSISRVDYPQSGK
jgi:hypothetical protein